MIKSSNAKLTPVYYNYFKRYKLKVFVPLSHLDKLSTELSKVGAGIIGNYNQCSFRTTGIGTFKPLKNSTPFTGSLNKLTFTEEVKLEMEFDLKDRNQIIDAMLEHHPYEETAYEIYEFVKREKNPSGYIAELPIKYSTDLFLRKFTELTDEIGISKKPIKKFIYLKDVDMNDEILKIAKKNKVNTVILESEKIKLLNI